MKKRLVSFVLALTLAAGITLTGCGGKSDGGPGDHFDSGKAGQRLDRDRYDGRRHRIVRRCG